MFSKLNRAFVCVVAFALLSACVTVGHQQLLLKQTSFSTNYERIKAIVLEEAANNGFSQLTSEIKPSEFNEWKGQLYFALKTPLGTDQLFVEFKKAGDSVSVYAHGAGVRSNPDSAAKAIVARLSRL